MHRLPKIPIFHKNSSRQKMGSARAGSPAATPMRPKPRLDRRKASKNIDYELPSTSASSEDSSKSSSSSSAAAALRTRSLDALPTSTAVAERTSFRMEGTEGECELILRSLGLSGPEDFAIPAEAWEAMKVRTSSSPSDVAVVPRFLPLNYSVCSPDFCVRTENACPRVDNYDVVSPKLEGFDFESSYRFNSSSSVNLTSPKIEGIDLGCSGGSISSNVGLACPKTVGIDLGCWESDDRFLNDFVAIRSGDAISKEDKLITGGAASDVVCDLSNRLGDCVRISDRPILRANGAVDPRGGGRFSDAMINESESGKVLGRGGIKGVRPPALAPPPAMSLPVIDNCCSTWDILKSFAPKDEQDTLRFGDSGAVGSDNEEDGKEYEEVHDVVVRSIAGGNGVLLGSGSCSFTTNSNDDDSSSTTTEPVSNNSPNGRFRCIITYWEKGELLGRGSFGSVYEGISDDGFFFAVKEVSLLDQGEEGRQSIYQLEQEIALLSQFEHENIVQYYGTQKDESKLYIFLEFVTKGSLLSLYQKYNLRDSQVSAYTRQILHGLKYLHDRNVVHRDIKCANILVDANGSVKLADFGLAKATKLNDVKSCKGTPFWMAPEVVNRKNQGYGLAADIWSLGCTVLEMLTRQFPYSHFEPMQALFRIGRGERPQIPETLSSDAREFIIKCLQVNPKVRPSAAQLLDHPFVKRPLPSSCSASPYHPSRRV